MNLLVNWLVSSLVELLKPWVQWQLFYHCQSQVSMNLASLVYDIHQKELKIWITFALVDRWSLHLTSAREIQSKSPVYVDT
jgi:hypothetical protein